MPASDAMVPYLQYYPAHSGLIRRIALHSLPFVIGRSPECNFVVSSPQVSKHHVEISRDGNEFQVRDLNSTNGTFVNGRPVSIAPLPNNTIIQVAHEEFRFVSAFEESSSIENSGVTELAKGKMPPSVALGTQHLKELLLRANYRILFQPIVSLNHGEPLGYEALARGTHNDLSIKPIDLFALAERCGMAQRLSQTLRRAAVQESIKLAGPGMLFLNLHPSEINDPSFLESLMDIQGRGRQIVLEIHEDAVADLPTWQKLRSELRDIGMQVAYDDFGAGQARYLELADSPPEFLKLDMKLIRDIHINSSRQHLVKALTDASNNLGVRVIAEGVESVEEEDACRFLGCHFGQGYFFARPQAAGSFLPNTPSGSFRREPVIP
jgi:EAL domain-containing protein (putative c-di-GMP-specific phosphodiesterase class I)